MSSRGQLETTKLKQNLEDQLDRLMNQLKDLEENKDLLDDDEYEDTKRETLDQLNEFKESLDKMQEGNLSLVDDINSMQLAIQAAISEAFRTPEVIKLFAKKQPGQLRERLAQIQRDIKIKKVPAEEGNVQLVEILIALKKLNNDLSTEEEQFLEQNSSESMKQFSSVGDSSLGSAGLVRTLEARIRQLEAHVSQLKHVLLKTDTKCVVCSSGLNQQLRANSKPGKRPFDFSRFNKRHIALKLLYLGWDHKGFCVQEETSNTIEAALFDALLKTKLTESRQSSNYHRCGRTDSGVSAFSQVISIDVRSNVHNGLGVVQSGQSVENSSSAQELDYIKMLNGVLPPDIRVWAWAPVDVSFSARFNCKMRTYKYLFPRVDLNFAAMRHAASHLVGEHDFRNFCKPDVEHVAHCVRKIEHVDLCITGPDDSQFSLVEATIVGQSFLWHQIRCIMSVLFLVGQGLESSDITKKLLDIEANPKKPQYSLAADFPLVLFDCEFDNLNWNYGDGSQLRATLIRLQKFWCSYAIKSGMIRQMMKSLEAKCSSSQSAFANNSDVFEKNIYPIDPVLSGDRPRHHVPLMNRQKCPSYDQRRLNLEKRNSKKPKLN